ncbi:MULTISPECIES: hypothetical protein [unclassified Virgibacillus]|uniref:hypothetical protein n=1 Tax=unclassified Virgibacillus TaxID=2620237 RepID=UPI0024DE6947|nr:hypothetical protein [Virgibacillus sp. LDC-1]
MRLLQISIFLSLFTIFLAGCIDIPIGSEGKLKVSKDNIKISDEEGNEQNISIDTEGENVTVSGSGSGSENEDVSMNIGNNVELPETFPSDIPIPEKANIFQATEADGMISIAYDAPTKVEDIEKLYTDYINSEIFSEQNSVIEQSGDINYHQYTAKRKEGTLNIRVMNSEKYADGSNVIIMLVKDNENK